MIQKDLNPPYKVSVVFILNRLSCKSRDRIPPITGKHGANRRIGEGCSGSNLLIRSWSIRAVLNHTTLAAFMQPWRVPPPPLPPTPPPPPPPPPHPPHTP